MTVRCCALAAFVLQFAAGVFAEDVDLKIAREEKRWENVVEFTELEHCFDPAKPGERLVKEFRRGMTDLDGNYLFVDRILRDASLDEFRKVQREEGKYREEYKVFAVRRAGKAVYSLSTRFDNTVEVFRTVFEHGRIVFEDCDDMFVRAYSDEGIADTHNLNRGPGIYRVPTFKSGRFTELTDERISIRFDTTDGRVFEKSVVIAKEKRLPSAAELAKRGREIRAEGEDCTLVQAATVAERDRGQSNAPVNEMVIKLFDSRGRILMEKWWENLRTPSHRTTLDEWSSRWRPIAVCRHSSEAYVLNAVEDGMLFVGRWKLNEFDSSEDYPLTVRFDRFGIYPTSSQIKLTPEQQAATPKLNAARLSLVAPGELTIVLDLADGGRLEQKFEIPSRGAKR